MVFYVVYKYAMELPGSPKEVIDEVVTKVEELVPELLNKAEELVPELLNKTEELVPELLNKAEELVPEIAEKIEDAVKNVDDLANDALNKFVERIPHGAKLVEVVDDALAGVACSCGLFGWTLSASRSPRSPAKSEVPLSEGPK
jgi:vacuolar-type H+-ATPase subunit H